MRKIILEKIHHKWCTVERFFFLYKPLHLAIIWKQIGMGEKNTKSDILLRKIDFYIFNLEPNLLKHSGASQMEVCLQGSLGSDASPFTTVRGYLETNAMPLIHSQTSMFRCHSDPCFSQSWTNRHPWEDRKLMLPLSCSSAGTLVHRATWRPRTGPSVPSFPSHQLETDTEMPLYKLSPPGQVPAAKGWSQLLHILPEVLRSSTGPADISTRVRRDPQQAGNLTNKKEERGVSLEGTVKVSRRAEREDPAMAQEGGPVRHFAKWRHCREGGRRGQREWKSHPLCKHHPFFCGLMHD